MRPTRGLGSAPLPPANRGCALLFGLAPGGVCRVSLRPSRAGIVTVALVLALRRTGVTRHPALRSSDFPHARRSPARRATIRPPRWPVDSTSSATRSDSGGPRIAGSALLRSRHPPCPRDPRRPPGADTVQRLVGEPVRGRVLGAGNVRRRPSAERREHRLCFRVQRGELRVLDPPPAVELLDDQLGVEEQVDLLGAEATRELERAK